MGQILPLPTRIRLDPIVLDRAAVEAIKCLASAELISESEAVRALENLGAERDDFDQIRSHYAVRRGRL